MAKRLFLLLTFSLISTFSLPLSLAATDSFSVNQPDFNAVETIPIVQEEPEVNESTDDYSDNDNSSVAESVVYVEVAEPVYVAPTNSIQINGRTIELGFTDSTAENAGGATYAWYYDSGSFIYGHNSWNVFGFLDSAFDGNWLEGMNFTVNMNGTTNNYTIVNYRLYDYDANYPSKLWYKGESISMRPIVAARLDKVQYKMAIMTCYAGSSKRLVVFAN